MTHIFTEKFRFLIVVSFALFICTHSMAQESDDYIFIKHDSIPMIFTDSVFDYNGNKIATEKLNVYNSLYFYSALTPSYPIKTVDKRFFEIPEEERKTLNCFKLCGGLLPVCINYMVKIDGEEILVDSHDKFREIFAPVESEQEAIAFAFILTDFIPKYNLDFLKQESEYYYYNLLVKDSISGDFYEKRDSLKMFKPLEETWFVYSPDIVSSYVEKKLDGYELLLYRYKVFGCSHPYIRSLIKVYFDGRVEILKEEEAFEHGAEIGLCID